MFVNIVILLTGIVYLKIPPKSDCKKLWLQHFAHNIFPNWYGARTAIFTNRWQGQFKGDDSIWVQGTA